MFDWISAVIAAAGYPGIALLMFAENLFPPIPSELIMPLAGFTAARGEFSFALVVASGTLGSVLGALFWYAAGHWLGCDRVKRLAARHGRWLTLAPEEVDGVAGWFRRHGGKSVLIGRLVPAVRSLVSLPAGIFEMSLGRFLLLSTIGSALWTALLTAAGYLLEAQYELVASWLNPASSMTLATILLWYFYRVATFRSARRRSADGRA